MKLKINQYYTLLSLSLPFFIFNKLMSIFFQILSLLYNAVKRRLVLIIIWLKKKAVWEGNAKYEI